MRRKKSPAERTKSFFYVANLIYYWYLQRCDMIVLCDDKKFINRKRESRNINRCETHEILHILLNSILKKEEEFFFESICTLLLCLRSFLPESSEASRSKEATKSQKMNEKMDINKLFFLVFTFLIICHLHCGVFFYRKVIFSFHVEAFHWFILYRKKKEDTAKI